MAKTLSNSGIATGNPVLAAQVSQSVQAFTGAESYDITISGSLNLPANTQMNGTASEAIYATSAGTVSGPTATITVSEETAAETNFIVFSPSSSVGGSTQNLKNTDTVGAGGATGGLEYNANTGNIKAKSFESSVSAATTVGFVGTSSFANSAVTAQASTLTNEAVDTTCFIPFYTSNTGDLPTKTNAGLLFDSATQKLTVTSASISDLISTGRVDYVSASFDDLVVSGAAKVNARFYALQSASLGDVTTSHRLRVAGQVIAALQGTLTEASLKFPLVASPDTFTAMHFDGTLDDMRIEYGMDAADEFFGRIRMSDNLTTDHFDIMFTGSGAGNNSFPLSAYGNKLLLSQEALKSKVGIGVSPSGSLGTMLAVEASASAASRVMAVRKENAGANVFEVEIDASGDGFVGILSGSNQDDGIRLHSNADSYFSKDVGIGLTAPPSKLTVRSSASAASRIVEVQNDAGSRIISMENDAANTAGQFLIQNTSANQKVKLSSADNDKMFLGVGTGAPNIGFGTTNPDADLHILKTGSVNIKLESDETNGTVYTRFLNDAISWRLGVQSNDRFALYDSTNAITHIVATNNALRPQVGIGTSNPLSSVVLDVVGPMRVSGSMVQRFQANATSQLTWNSDGLITGNTGQNVGPSSSLVILTDNGTGPNSASLDISGWVGSATTGQTLEVALIGDASPASGILLQYYDGGTTLGINGSTFGATFDFSSSVFNCPSRDRGVEVKIIKTGTSNIKVFGSAMIVDNT